MASEMQTSETLNEQGLNEKKRKWGLIGYENRVLIILCFAFGFVFVDRMAIATLFPFMQDELHLNNTDLGVLSGALAITWSLSGPLLGWVTSRVKKIVPFFAILILIFSLLSFTAGLVATFAALLILRGAMGIVEGPTLPIAQGIMSAESSEKRRGFNMGLLQTTSPSLLATTLAPIALVAIASHLNWRYGFYLTIIPGLLIVLASLYFFDEPKKVHVSTVISSEQEEKITFVDCLKFKNLWLCLLGACCMVTWYIVIVTFAPTYFVDTVGMTPAKMGLAVAMLGVGGMIWGTAVPTVSAWLGRKPMVIIACVVGIFSPLAIIYLHSISFALLAIILIIVHMGQGAHPLLFSVIPSETVSQKYIPAAVGLVMGVGEFVGGFIMPIVAGAAADHISTSAPFYIAAVAAVLGALVALGLTETHPRHAKEAAPVLATEAA